MPLFGETGGHLWLRLADRTPVRLRGLGPEDAQAHLEHLLRLPPEDQRLRFHGAIGEAAITAYANGLDWRRTYIFGAFVDDVLRGVGELIPTGEADRGELALSVEPRFQHLGLGRILISAVVIAGRRLGLSELHLYYLHGNMGMRSLAREASAQFRTEGGVAQGIIRLTPEAPQPMPRAS